MAKTHCQACGARIDAAIDALEAVLHDPGAADDDRLNAAGSILDRSGYPRRGRLYAWWNRRRLNARLGAQLDEAIAARKAGS